MPRDNTTDIYVPGYYTTTTTGRTRYNWVTVPVWEVNEVFPAAAPVHAVTINDVAQATNEVDYAVLLRRLEEQLFRYKGKASWPEGTVIDDQTGYPINQTEGHING